MSGRHLLARLAARRRLGQLPKGGETRVEGLKRNRHLLALEG